MSGFVAHERNTDFFYRGGTMKNRWLYILSIAFLFAASVRAQTNQITGIAHIAYRVSDVGGGVAFFQKLGFEQAFANTNRDGKVTQSFIKVNNRQFIEIYPQLKPGEELGWMHVCYESGDLNALYKTLDAHGLKPSEVRKAGAGNLLTVIRDPEGRVTEFTQYMPGSRHMLDAGKHLGEHRVSDLMSGFELPVPDLDAARKFYVNGMGLVAREAGTGIRITTPESPEIGIEIEAARTDLKPATIFRVKNLAAAQKQLEAAGLRVTKDHKRINVADPDGNIFVFAASLGQ